MQTIVRSKTEPLSARDALYVDGELTQLVPVFDPKPVGVIEWAERHGTLYGVDAAGTVWVFRDVSYRRRQSLYQRLADMILRRRR